MRFNFQRPFFESEANHMYESESSSQICLFRHSLKIIYVYTYICILPRCLFVVKNLPASEGDTGDVGLIPGSGKFPGGGYGNHFSILVWKIPWMEEPEGYCPWGHEESDMTEHTDIHNIYMCVCVYVHMYIHMYMYIYQHCPSEILYEPHNQFKFF